jgi:hypothetical protein
MIRLLLTVFGVASLALAVGCAPRTEPQPTPTGPRPTPAPADPQPEPGPAPPVTPPSQPDVTPQPDTAAFRAGHEELTVTPGGEARVKLIGLPAGEEVRVMVEPADAQITAVVADRQTLTVRAGDEATGKATVTLRAGEHTARVQVTVQENEGVRPPSKPQNEGVPPQPRNDG